MSAPVTERQRVGTATRDSGRGTPARNPTGRGRTATIPPQRGAGLPTIPAQRGSSRAGAAQRAYARRDDRVRRLVGARPARTAAPAGRAQFILLVMVLLGAGLVATLWLSTAAAQDSYRLQDARAGARTLTEQSERLRREVTSMEAAPALAQRAADLGLVPVQNPARLVVGPDGAVRVVGDPAAAAAPAASAVAPAAPAAAPARAVSAEAASQAQPDPAAQPAPAAQPDPAAQPGQPGAATPNAAAQPAADPNAPAAGAAGTGAAGQPGAPAAGQAAAPPPGGAG